jgi:4-hydroxy-2,2'-bipyrrole-5-carbaldehyde O-methyltransferase
MDLRTLLSLPRGRLRLLVRAARLFTPFYRLTFAASAARAGLVRVLARGPQPEDTIAAEICPDPAARASLSAWLDLGVELGELAGGPSGYGLRGHLIRALADPANDDIAALIEEVACFHHRWILETPGRWRRRDPWAPFEHDGALIARSSRILEPFVFRLADSAVPAEGPVDLLEVGCGSGTYLCRAAGRNPQLRAVGVESQPAVAAEARRAIAGRGLADRVHVETADIRDRAPDGPFDVVTLYNVLYYLPREERAALTGKLASLLRPGGRLVLSTSCQGGSAGMRVLDLWMSSTRGFGPLPAEEELLDLVRSAGFTDVQVRRLIPGEAYLGLVATKAPGDVAPPEGDAGPRTGDTGRERPR